MTDRKALIRVNAALIGAVLVGYGLSEYDVFGISREPPPDPDDKPQEPSQPRKLALPKDGVIAGRAGLGNASPDSSTADRSGEVRTVLGDSARKPTRKSELLSTTSDRSLTDPEVAGAGIPAPRFGNNPQVVEIPQVTADPLAPPAIEPDAMGQEIASAPAASIPDKWEIVPSAELANASSEQASESADVAAGSQPATQPVQPDSFRASAAPIVGAIDPVSTAETPATPVPESSAFAFGEAQAPQGDRELIEDSSLTSEQVQPSAPARLAMADLATQPAAVRALDPASTVTVPQRPERAILEEPRPDSVGLMPQPESFGQSARDRLLPDAADGSLTDPAELAQRGERSTLPGTSGLPVFSYQDELILDVQVKGIDASDTIVGYGTRQGVYLPLGTLARILDLALVVGVDGNYAQGWTLSEDRTLTIDLEAGTFTLKGEEFDLPADAAAAFDGELYLKSDQFRRFLPVDVEVNLRRQSVLIETLEPFPFQERMAREAARARLEARSSRDGKPRWEREETPWLLASVPMADLELRALSDSARGERIEGDLRVSGDLAFLTAETYFSADTKDGLTASLVRFGREDPDADLFGPLKATEFSFGDIATTSLPLGLRGVVGRGAMVTNSPLEAVSVFENIDLRGVLPNGYEVELYRNDVLIGSTRDAVNGQYEFLQIPVDFGLNVFRLVFFGPQGQRSEEVRRISVGDGRLSPGQFVYKLGAAQKDENVLGVRDPFYFPPQDFGTWRTTAELAYGVSSDVTAMLSGAWFETVDDDRWLVSGGLRSGVGQFALKTDLAFSDGGASAIGAGIGGRFGNSTFALDHFEYSGPFIDETRAINGDALRRSTELDFNTSLSLGNPVTGLIIPITARVRHYETTTGRKQTNAGLRASSRVGDLLASNTLEYSRTALAQAQNFSQLFGNFDLASLGQSKLRTRTSLAYQILPDPDILGVSLEADYSIDEKTAVRGRLGYVFDGGGAQVGLSAVREFDRFTLAFESNYDFDRDDYSVGLRFAASFGRNPRSGGVFMARPGLSSMGAASLRAFQDLDGDSVFSEGDRPLPEVDFVAFNQSSTTAEDGTAFLGGLGNGRRVNLQVDTTTLPDITLEPVATGIEIVPRPGRIHSSDFPVVALSEVEGTVTFESGNDRRGVSGVRLQLRNLEGEVTGIARTEIDGYFFFEKIKPGTHVVMLDDEQAARLQLCLADVAPVVVGYESDIYLRDLTVRRCDGAVLTRAGDE